MNWGIFRKTYDKLAENSRLYLFVIVALVIVILSQQWMIFTIKTETRLVPPYLDRAVNIGYATASAGYYESWGLYVAELVGNLTPGDATYVANSLGKLFDANDFAIVKGKVLATAAAERGDQANFFFQAKRTIWQAANKTVFVYGLLSQINNLGQTVSKVHYTFSMAVHIEGGRPVLDNFNAYQGGPHTIKWAMVQEKDKRAK
ncbi:type IV conjugative transfer system protein TraE [Acidithiobacillus ferrivorans SS3]|uniref:Type IV conjugative transfer system protein TraE n=1 Tax=Acidithiobacillus ferrivorans SS3 TaxID=743299 RepID=G0JUF5_9PROT|nr:type IV conjugative transfer system protein TraE [Acidithiobacillus ferrivorans]AEM49124.1 type IV conjugative transfer system protein TraE [Acidithiobacillus ferrivorans SS3]